MTFTTDIATFSQESIDSMVKANSAATKGFEQLANYFVALTTKSFEDAIAAGKKIAAAKTPLEFVQVQTKLAEESFDVFVGESKKVSELATAIVKDVTAPLTAQFKSAVAQAPKVAAATVKKAA